MSIPEFLTVRIRVYATLNFITLRLERTSKCITFGIKFESCSIFINSNANLLYWRENAKKSFDWNLGTPQKKKYWSPKLIIRY